jgi:hypothetical protein
MASSPENLPYGARWGYRTPSPEFARSAVEPLSPTNITSAATNTSPFAGAQLPPTTYTQSPPFPSMSQAPVPPSYSNNYMLDSGPAKQLPESNNRLDALAEIALMHGAGRLAPASPVASSRARSLPNPASLFIPPIVSGDLVTSPSSAIAFPPKSLEIADTVPVEPRELATNGVREQKPIGHERRAVSDGRGRIADPDASVLQRLTTIASAKTITVTKTVPAVKPPGLATQQAVGDGLSPTRKNVATAENFEIGSAQAQPKSEDISMLFKTKEGNVLSDGLTVVDEERAQNNSLPTPTQDDHVIASSVGSIDTAPEDENKAVIANLTPEFAEEDGANIPKVPEGAIFGEGELSALSRPNIQLQQHLYHSLSIWPFFVVFHCR